MELCVTSQLHVLYVIDVYHVLTHRPETQSIDYSNV